VNRERARNILVMLSGAAAAACVAELLWLREAQLSITRPGVAAMFLPWLLAAATNLGVWYLMLPERGASAFTALSRVLFWVVAALFAAGFAAIYGWALLGV
jgi:hypothetical protein